MKNIIAPYIILMVVSLIIGCGGGVNYDASGTFEATEVVVSSEVAGKILSFDCIEGQKLESGQRVGKIDSVQLALKKEQTKASISAAKSRHTNIATQIAVTKQQIVTATNDKLRIERLLKANAATQKQLDDINAMILLYEKQLAAQTSILTNQNRVVSGESTALEIQVDQLDDQINKSNITSPIRGTVLVKYAEKGELAYQGQPLFRIADIENMILRAYVTAGQLSHVKLGQTVYVYVDFGKNNTRTYKGVITWISSRSEFTPKSIQTKDERANLVYAVKIAVKNDGYIKIGMYGDVAFGK